MSKRFLRLPAVIEKTGMARSSVYAMIKAKRFPPPVPLSGRAVAWVESEVEQWIQDRISASREESAAS